jgi:hypothetical protein
MEEDNQKKVDDVLKDFTTSTIDMCKVIVLILNKLTSLEESMHKRQRTE